MSYQDYVIYQRRNAVSILVVPEYVFAILIQVYIVELLNEKILQLMIQA